MSQEYSPYAMTPAEERAVLPHSLTFTVKQVEAARAYLKADAHVSRVEYEYTSGVHVQLTWDRYTDAIAARTTAGENLNTLTDHDGRLRDAILYYLEVVRGERY
jgi:hypothetical protein